MLAQPLSLSVFKTAALEAVILEESGGAPQGRSGLQSARPRCASPPLLSGSVTAASTGPLCVSMCGPQQALNDP